MDCVDISEAFYGLLCRLGDGRGTGDREMMEDGVEGRVSVRWTHCGLLEESLWWYRPMTGLGEGL